MPLFVCPTYELLMVCAKGQPPRRNISSVRPCGTEGTFPSILNTCFTSNKTSNDKQKKDKIIASLHPRQDLFTLLHNEIKVNLVEVESFLSNNCWTRRRRQLILSVTQPDSWVTASPRIPCGAGPQVLRSVTTKLHAPSRTHQNIASILRHEELGRRES